MKKLVVRISGGLGNQMFEFALGLAMSQRTGRELRLDLTDFIIFRSGRTYQLDHFRGPLLTKRWNFINTYLFLGAWIVHKRISKKLAAILFRLLKVRVMQTPQLFHADPLFLDYRDYSSETLCIAGCYGILPYFNDAADIIRKHFQLSNSLSSKNKAYFEKFCSMDATVSIHVRRADYLLASNGSPVLNFEYYLNAVEVIKRHETHPVWVIFSDDIQWCKEKFAFLDNIIFVEGNEATPWEDIHLIAACYHHITTVRLKNPVNRARRAYRGFRIGTDFPKTLEKWGFFRKA